MRSIKHKKEESKHRERKKKLKLSLESPSIKLILKVINGNRTPKCENNSPVIRLHPFETGIIETTPKEQNKKFKKGKEKNCKTRQKPGPLKKFKDGTTTMNILLNQENEGPEKLINLGAFIGKLQHGTGQLQGFREDRRNSAKIVKPLNYGAFSSFAPTFDSRFSNLSKEECGNILNAYGDETSVVNYAESNICFSKDSPFSSVLATGLLNLLENRKTMSTIEMENQKRQEVVSVVPPDPEYEAPNNDEEKYKNTKIDYNLLRTLSELGLDVKFIDDLENCQKMYEMSIALDESLNKNSQLLRRLHEVQNDRLSAPLPAHLSHIQHANINEINLANKITSNLTEIAKQLPPIAIATPESIRKAIGMSNVGLASFQTPIIPILGHINSDIIDTNLIDMETEPSYQDIGQR